MSPLRVTRKQYALLAKAGKLTPAVICDPGATIKYHNHKVVVDGIKFDSIREAKRYRELWMMSQAGAISRLKLQVPFACNVNGKNVCTYIADFTYLKADGTSVVEDVKGMKTPVYRLKKKLVEAIYGIEIREV